jgi:hypothetical protein
VYIGTEAGLWYTEDVTANPVEWTVDSSIPVTRVVMLKYRTSDHQIVLGTHGRGVWTTNLNPPPADPRLVAGILLEGPYASSGMMSVSGAFEAERPLTQPYGAAAFDGTPNDYDGVESVGAFPEGTIDWMLVELRSDTTAASLVSGSTRPAFVLEDGLVVGLDGDTLQFTGVTPGAYHVVFRHRNHLAVISDAPHDFAAGVVEVDLRTTPSLAYTQGGAALKDLGGGYYGMFAADGTVDGIVTAPDFNAWNAATTGGSTGYLLEDFNLDRNVTAPDFNLWNANTTAGAASQVP